jgi:DNA-binding PadR family transcriptional regulator
MTGYAVRAAIRDVLGHFWSESFGQIYPTLAELERSGKVQREGPATSGTVGRTRPAKFAVTESGLARLRELLAQPARPAVTRSGLLLRLFFGRHLGPAACQKLVIETRARAQEQLAHYADVRAQIAADEAGEADRPYWLLTVAAGEHAARATVAWADESLRTLDRLAAEQGSSR